MTPTENLYGSMTAAYDFFNQELFDNKLPNVIFTTQRKKGVMGYFSKNRWASKDGSICHEIAINPTYIAHSTILELFQTLVHESCHLYQEHYGTPSRNAYHNKEFAFIMRSRGLIPSTTGAAGGSQTGQKMSDYPDPDGDFIKAARKLVSSGKFKLEWIDRYAKKNR